MDLTPSEDQRLIVEAVRGLARELAPDAGRWDADDRIPASALARLGELGLPGLFLEEARGGSGLGHATAVLALEALAGGSAALALRLAAHTAGALTALAAIGLDAEALAPYASGERWAARVDGIEAEGVGARRRLHGDARCVVGAGSSERLVVLTLGGEVDLLEGIPAGVSLEPLEGLGMRGAGLAHVRLDAVEVGPPLGVVDAATSERLGAIERLAVSAVGVGIGRAALAEARAYALERKQFGRPIADFQAIQWMLADAATEVDAAHLLALRTGLALDEGRTGGSEARTALILTAEAALSAAQKAIQIHGGYGFVREFPVERLARDARYLGVALGGRDANREALGRELLA